VGPWYDHFDSVVRRIGSVLGRICASCADFRFSKPLMVVMWLCISMLARISVWTQRCRGVAYTRDNAQMFCFQFQAPVDRMVVHFKADETMCSALRPGQSSMKVVKVVIQTRHIVLTCGNPGCIYGPRSLRWPTKSQPYPPPRLDPSTLLQCATCVSTSSGRMTVLYLAPQRRARAATACNQWLAPGAFHACQYLLRLVIKHPTQGMGVSKMTLRGSSAGNKTGNTLEAESRACPACW
jgi:hypothetical protein